MIQRILAFACTSLFIGGAAYAGEHWQSVGFRISPQNVPKVVAATEKFMATKTGKAMPGTLTLMARVIDGTDPSTHSFISSMDSVAEREQWNKSLVGNADWDTFVDVVSKNGEIGGTYRMAFLKNWGKPGEGHTAWQLHMASVKDPAKYVQALDRLMASEDGKGFPGSLFLSAVVAGGMTPVTHVVSVGFPSAAAGEAWNDKMSATKAWADFLAEVGEVSEYRGSIVMRTLGTWGTPTTP